MVKRRNSWLQLGRASEIRKYRENTPAQRRQEVLSSPGNGGHDVGQKTTDDKEYLKGWRMTRTASKLPPLLIIRKEKLCV